MSSNWLLNARRYGQSFGKKFKNLENAFNAKVTDDSTDEGEDQQTRTEAEVARSYLKFCDDLHNYGGLIPPSGESYLSFEPDLDTCKLYIEFDSIGGLITDYSGFAHHARSYGLTRMGKGIDYGEGGSWENVFDGRSAYAEVPHDSDLDFSSVSVGFSLLFRFKPFSLASTGGARPVVICKRDSMPPDNSNWYSFELSSNGRCAFNIVKGSTIYSIVTPTNIINTNGGYYDVAVTYKQSDQTLKLFINNTKYDTVNDSLQFATQTPQTTNSPLNIKIGKYTNNVAAPTGEKYPLRADSKLYFGTFQQLKYFRNKVLTDQQVGFHHQNRLTISDIPFAQVARSGSLILVE